MFCNSICVRVLVVVPFIYQGFAQINSTQVNKIKVLSDKGIFSKGYDKLTAFNLSSLSNTSRKMMIEKITSKCLHQYSIPCLILDLSYFIDKLGQTKSFQILPGISLVSADNGTSKEDMPEEVVASVVRSNANSTDLNIYLLRKLSKYFSSLSIRVNLFDNPIMQNLKYFTTSALGIFFSNPLEETGRGTKTGKKDSNAMWTLALMLALSALAGKAMIAGTIALILSLICLLKGCGGGHKAAHYEIITKPAHLHDVEHLGLTGSIGNSAYGGYARHLIQDRIIPALNIFDNDSYDDKELVQEVIPMHTYQVTSNYGQNSMVHR